jgi:hypothetical protein
MVRKARVQRSPCGQPLQAWYRAGVITVACPACFKDTDVKWLEVGKTTERLHGCLLRVQRAVAGAPI